MKKYIPAQMIRKLLYEELKITMLVEGAGKVKYKFIV